MSFFNPIEWFGGFPAELSVFLLSMLPITELRASIPIALEVYGLDVIHAWLLAVIGNIVPTIFILLVIPFAHDWLMRQRFLGPVLKRKLERASNYFEGKQSKYGAAALVLFVGIPLPFTGAWTGSLIAFIFNIPFKKAMPLIALGVCMAATIVTLVTLFAGGTLRAVFG
jgi:uncharacterized membrane protein